MKEENKPEAKLKPWEKAWVNPKFIFKNPRCLKSRIPMAPTCAYDEAMKSDVSEDESPKNEVTLEDVSMPKPKAKPSSKSVTKRESLQEWKKRRRRFVTMPEKQAAVFPTRIGFPYSDLPMEPKREAERVLPNFPPGMSRAERRHWESWR